MYVCGKGSDGYGTLLPAAFEAWREGDIEKIHVVANSRGGATLAQEKCEALKKKMALNPEVSFSSQEESPQAHLQCLKAHPNTRLALISTPDREHSEIAIDLMNQGLHVQVVKPLAPNLKDNEAMLKAQKANHVLGMVEYHKRYDEANLKLLGLIRDGQLGELHSFDIQYSQKKVIPTETFSAWVDQIDIFQYLGVHYVDLIQFLTSAKPQRLLSLPSSGFLEQMGVHTPDSIRTIIEWRETSGRQFHSSHLTGWIDPNSSSSMSDQRIEVIGTAGRYRSDQKDRGVTLVTDQAGIEQINPYFSQFYPSSDGEGDSFSGYGPKSVIQFIRDALDVLNEKKSVEYFEGLRATFASSLCVSACIDASRESISKTSAWIEIEK